MGVFLRCIITRARIGLEIIYTRLSVFLVMAEIGRNCAVSAFH